MQRREPASPFPRQVRMAAGSRHSPAAPRPWWGNGEGPMYLYSGLSPVTHPLSYSRGVQSQQSLRLAPFT